jgi:hypothetical protein
VRIGVLPTPWPSFCVAARPESDPELTRNVRVAALQRAQRLKADPALPDLVVQRYGLARPEATQWAAHVQWSDPSAPLDPGTLRDVNVTMLELGRVSRMLAPSELVAGEWPA